MNRPLGRTVETLVVVTILVGGCGRTSREGDNVAPMVQNGDSRTLIETLASADFRGADGLIADGADVNRPNEKGLTPLIWSMANGLSNTFSVKGRLVQAVTRVPC